MAQAVAPGRPDGLAALRPVGQDGAAAGGDRDDGDDHGDGHGLRPGDRDILIAAEIAEALAVTTYSNIIDIAPFFQHLE
ncbi:MAG: hypothetical protein ABR562_02910, partial [Thermoplasmatota archaeon]